MDIGLIRDEANVAKPRRGPRVELHPLSENLADTIELEQGADPANSEPNETTPAESAMALVGHPVPLGLLYYL